MLNRWMRFGTLLVVASVAAHCSSDPQAPSPPPTQVAPSPPLPPPTVDATSACVTIGPEGGTLVHAAGAQLIVPAGALDTSSKLCLTGATPPATEALGGVALAQSIVASPAGQTFRKPVDLVLPFDPTRMASGTSVDDVQMRMAPDGSTDFESLQSTTDLAARVVRARTLHFTQFVPVVNPNPVFITTPASLQDGTSGTPYAAQTFVASGGTAPYQWSIASGSSLPAGLSLSTAGVFDGTPTLAGNYGFFVVASDSASHRVQEAFALTVGAPNNATPTLTQINPTTVPEASATTTISLTGTGFAPTMEARWDGTSLPTTFISTTQASAAIPATNLANAGTHSVTVFNPAPGGGTSGAQSFVISAVAPNPVPSITSVSPAQLPVSHVDTVVTVNGTNFVATSSVLAAGQKLAVTYVSATQLTATVPAALVSAPGTLVFGVSNPAPGGGSSVGTVSVPVGVLTGAPVLSQVSPDTIAQFATATLTLNGSGFTASSAALWDGAFVATTFVSATQLTTVIPGASTQTTGAHQVSVSNPAPGGGTSAPLTVTVSTVVPNPVPTVSAVSPSPLVTSTIDTQITITGTGFNASTSAVIGNQGISTSFVSATQIRGTVPASYLASPGTLQIGAYNPAPGGGFSATVAVPVQTPNPVPTITTVTPNSVTQNGLSFSLVVYGTSFVPGAKIFFGSTAVSTSVTGTTNASCTIPASLIVNPGTVQVVVVNPAPGGGTSSALPVTIRSAATFPGAWTRVSPATATPSYRNEMHGFAALGNGLVLFGGYTGSAYLNDTWTFDGNGWTKNAPSISPPGRGYHMMATFGNRVVLFGGLGGPSQYLNDTWQWDGSQWTQMTPAHSPPARLTAAMASVGNKLVLYGGTPNGTSSSTMSDTWEWDGTDWTQRTPAANPGPRRWHSFASLGGQAVLFGGEKAGVLMGDTWTWDGTTWTQVATAGPSPRGQASVTQLGSGLILSGGYQYQGYDDTWRWDGTTWTEYAPATPFASGPSLGSATLGNAAYVFAGASVYKAQDTCAQAPDCASGVCWNGVCCPNACATGQSCSSGICQ